MKGVSLMVEREDVTLEVQANGYFGQRLKACGRTSWMVIVPKRFMDLLKWEGRDKITMELDYDGKCLVLRKGRDD
jgi:hypothetical protein